MGHNSRTRHPPSQSVGNPPPYQPQSKICQLPYEVFDIIFQSLPVWELDQSILHGSFHRENRYALSSLSQSCRGLRHLTEPVLYSTIVGQDRNQDYWEFESAEKRTEVGSSNRRGRILKLLRTLLSRPRLAYYVKSLVILPRQDSSNNCPSRDKWLMWRYQLQTQFFTSNSLLQKFFIADLLRGSTNAEAALLLGLSSNIEHLHLGITPNSFDVIDPWLIRILRDARLKHHSYRYSQLERITLLHCTQRKNLDDRFDVPPNRIFLELLRIPTLKCFETGVDLHRFSVHDTMPSDLTSFTHLDDEQCRISRPTEDFNSLKTIFEGCKGLKHFEKRFACVGDPAAANFHEWIPAWTWVPEVLSSQHHTLETIHLSTLDVSWRTTYGVGPPTWSSHQLPPFSPIPSLRHFAALRSLSIDQIILLGNRSEKQSRRARVDALPTSIQHVVITRCKGYVMDAQLFFMVESIGSFPQLKSIVTERARDWAGFTKTIMLMDRQEESKSEGSNKFVFANDDDNSTFLYLASAFEEDPKDRGWRLTGSPQTYSIFGSANPSSQIDDGRAHYYGYEDSFEGQYQWLSQQHKILVEGFRNANVEWVYK